MAAEIVELATSDLLGLASTEFQEQQQSSENELLGQVISKKRNRQAVCCEPMPDASNISIPVAKTIILLEDTWKPRKTEYSSKGAYSHFQTFNL